MPCYSPMLMEWTGEYTESGKKKYKFVGRGTSDQVDFAHLKVPCGQCIGCRLDYSRKWADRMMLELDTWKKAIFVTLTYDRNHVHSSVMSVRDVDGLFLPLDPQERIVDGEYLFPDFYTLDKRDCQLFMKSLRRQFEDRIVRFYLAGEYGEKTLRPHYHAIIYNIGLNDFSDLKKDGKNELGDQYYHSEWMDKLWKRGKVVIADVSWKTCAYVARYVTKKVNGPRSVEYGIRNCQAEFSLMSRKPGIGKKYLDEHPYCLDYREINLPTADGGLKIQIPEYYLRQIELTDPEKFAKMKKDRMFYANDKMLLELQKTDIDEIKYLEMKEQIKTDSVKLLKRAKE